MSRNCEDFAIAVHTYHFEGLKNDPSLEGVRIYTWAEMAKAIGFLFHDRIHLNTSVHAFIFG